MIWVAEIGSAHNGSKAQAFEMIRQAKLAGATIAKFQFWDNGAQRKYVYGVREDSLWVEAGDPIVHIRNCATEWAQDLADWCDHFDIEFMASIWSMEGLETARSVGMKRYKIAHQIAETHLVELPQWVYELSRDGKEIFKSGGAGSGNIYGLWCTKDYPAYPGAWIPLERDFEEYYGYSSHMHGYADALIAVARGAQYIEKHVTLNKADTSLRDNSFALSFQEFGEMVTIGNEMARLR